VNFLETGRLEKSLFRRLKSRARADRNWTSIRKFQHRLDDATFG
jgi:hypothetical protein